MAHKKKKKEFNDLLIPVIFVLLILPFVTRLLIYESGLGKYAWFPDQDLQTDFFTYYKSYFFVLTAVISGCILAVYFVLYRSQIKNMKIFIPLGIYSLIVLISTIFSVDVHTSVVGGVTHFENTFVLLGYVIIVVYTYQLVGSEEDYMTILKVLVISSLLFGVIGLFQMAGKDIFEFTWLQKLIIPRDYWQDYVGNINNYLSTNAVSLSLFNPNYASVYVSMLIPLFMIRLLQDENKKIKGFYGLILILLFIIQFKTYSRTGFISLFVTLLFMAYFYRNKLKQYLKYCLAGCLFLVVLFVLVDSFSEFRFATKINDTFKSFNKAKNEKPLEAIYTNTDSVVIKYGGKVLKVALAKELSDNTLSGNGLNFFDANDNDISENYNFNTGILHVKPFEKMVFSRGLQNKQDMIKIHINDYDWNFSYDKEQGYSYRNDFGKSEKLVAVSAFGFKNYGHIGSGRGYIWSKSIPLLLKNPLIGTGPDTYTIVFPQWDHVGKANYCKTPYTIIERPHNMYLMMGIQTGIPSLILFLVFYFMYFHQSFGIYNKIVLNGYRQQLGLGCFLATISYMISGLFNDSTLQTTPAFWVFLGLGLAANYGLKQDTKRS